MALIALYWGLMILCYIIASKCRQYREKFSFLDGLLTILIVLLVFVMGLRMGSNDEIIGSLGSIGVMSLVMTILIIVGAILSVTVTRKIFRMDKYGSLMPKYSSAAQSAEKTFGEIEKELEVIEEIKEEEQQKSSSFMTWAIVIATAVGILMGYLLVDKLFSDMEFFDIITSNAMVVGLASMLSIIGFNMGLEGTIIQSFAKVGFRVLAFPVAILISTAVIAVICTFIMPLSIKESLAVCFGFGWYTFAPVAIANEGYAVASAVSFMHNVIRETAGIVLIPVFAKRIGYIEVTAIPGVAAMDICLPIVGRVTRSDIIPYSFIIGVVEALAVPLLVPLFIGL